MPSSSLMTPLSPTSTLFPYTTLFRSPRFRISDQTSPPPRSGWPDSWPRSAPTSGAPPPPARTSMSAGCSSTSPVIRPNWWPPLPAPDRKSTRLNSSHLVISYAVFFFNDTPLPDIHTLSLHDALPISQIPDFRSDLAAAQEWVAGLMAAIRPDQWGAPTPCTDFDVRGLLEHLSCHPAKLVATATGARSEEHTSELQSPCNLVCRLLL